MLYIEIKEDIITWRHYCIVAYTVCSWPPWVRPHYNEFLHEI